MASDFGTISCVFQITVEFYRKDVMIFDFLGIVHK